MFLRENDADAKTFGSVWDGALLQSKPYQFINSLRNKFDPRSHAFIANCWQVFCFLEYN